MAVTFSMLTPYSWLKALLKEEGREYMESFCMPSPKSQASEQQN